MARRKRTLEILAAFDAGEHRLGALVERFGGREPDLRKLLHAHGRKGAHQSPRHSPDRDTRTRNRIEWRRRLNAHLRVSPNAINYAGVDPDFDGAA